MSSPINGKFHCISTVIVHYHVFMITEKCFLQFYPGLKICFKIVSFIISNGITLSNTKSKIHSYFIVTRELEIMVFKVRIL